MNPRWTLGMSIEEPLLGQKELDARRGRSASLELVELVGLPRETADIYPHQTTAGVQQRVATARAIAVNPELVVLDEPTSALDMSVKAQMIELLIRLQRELGISYLFISHDMTAVKMIAHDIAIMYLGRMFEAGPAAEVFDRQLNPYGRALLVSVLCPIRTSGAAGSASRARSRARSACRGGARWLHALPAGPAALRRGAAAARARRRPAAHERLRAHGRDRRGRRSRRRCASRTPRAGDRLGG